MDELDIFEIIFLVNFVCLYCGYSISEFELCLFLFNNLVGVCGICDGLGICQFFDLFKVVINDELSLFGGVICGWDKCSYYYFQMFQVVVDYYGFSFIVLLGELFDEYRNIVFYGFKGKFISFCYINDCGDIMECKYLFEGIILNMECCYWEMELNMVCEEFFKFLSQ